MNDKSSDQLNDSLTKLTELDIARIEANQAALELVLVLDQTRHQIVTAESITGGLIFSTLVDIPFGGSNKYGSFIVYDSEAKRNQLGILINNVYSLKCAEEMAISSLKKSSATIAISATGNAIPRAREENHLGEVFIGLAGYVDDKIIVVSTAHNFCSNSEICSNWCAKSEIKLGSYIEDSSYEINKNVSQLIRNKTVAMALGLCKKFVLEQKLLVDINKKIDLNESL